DIYQGTEVWDFSLVDPDNRRPVDYALRRRLLAEAQRVSAAEAWQRPDEGLPKIWLIRVAMQVRQRFAEAFGVEGAYTPLAASGPKAAHVVAFARGEQVVTVAPRLSGGIPAKGGWSDTRLALPPGAWRNALTGEKLPAGDARLE